MCGHEILCLNENRHGRAHKLVIPRIMIFLIDTFGRILLRIPVQLFSNVSNFTNTFNYRVYRNVFELCVCMYVITYYLDFTVEDNP